MTDQTQRPTATIYQFPARKTVRRAGPHGEPLQQALAEPAGGERAAGIIDGPCWYHDEAIASAAADRRR